MKYTLSWTQTLGLKQISKQSTNPKKYYNQALIHVLIWLLYKVFSYYLSVNQGGILPHTYWTLHMLVSPMELLLFYSYYYYLIPRLLEKKIGLSFLIITLGVVTFIPFFAIQGMHWIRPNLLELSMDFQQHKNYLHHHLGLSLYTLSFVALASGLRFAVDWFKNRRFRAALAKQNLMSEIALLKSQINPHFLFNTLNSIYTLSYKKDENTPDTILKLSDLMRYMLYDASGDHVILEKEIAYIQNYIALQRLRLANPLQVKFTIKGDCSNKSITPMLLIPFVENAFKHGLSPHNPSEIFIELNVEGDYLHFCTVNPIVSPQLVNQGQAERGIGYRNVHRRLQLLYPERHQLNVYTSRNQYFVDLTIKLDSL